MSEALNAKNLQMQRYVTSDWRAIVPVGTTVEDVLRPSFWAHIMRGQIKVFDKIEVLSEDGELDIELRVTGLGQQAIMMRVIREQIDSKPAAKKHAGPVAAPGDPRVEFSPSDKWRVIDETGSVVARGFATVEDAEAELATYLSQTAAAA